MAFYAADNSRTDTRKHATDTEELDYNLFSISYAKRPPRIRNCERAAAFEAYSDTGSGGGKKEPLWGSISLSAIVTAAHTARRVSLGVDAWERDLFNRKVTSLHGMKDPVWSFLEFRTEALFPDYTIVGKSTFGMDQVGELTTPVVVPIIVILRGTEFTMKGKKDRPQICMYNVYFITTNEGEKHMRK